MFVLRTIARTAIVLFSKAMSPASTERVSVRTLHASSNLQLAIAQLL